MKFVPLLILSLFFAGCATTYQPNSITGGFSDKQLTENYFWVGFSGNGYVSASDVQDMCLLRAAEICYSKGFNYFIIHDQRSENERHDVTTTNIVNTSYGAIGISNSIPIYKPSSGINIEAFVHRVEGRDSLKVSDIIAKLKPKYAQDKIFVKGNFDVANFEEVALEFFKNKQPRPPKCSSSEDKPVLFLSNKNIDFGFRIVNSLTIYDNPFSETQARAFANKLAKISNSDTVLFITNHELLEGLNITLEARSDGLLPSCLYYVGMRQPRMGINFEPGLLQDKIYEIRNFSNGSLASTSGLKLGDRILSIEGISTLDKSSFDLTCFEAGDVIEVDVNRGGELATIAVILTN